MIVDYENETMDSVSFSRWMSHRMMECFSFYKQTTVDTKTFENIILVVWRVDGWTLQTLWILKNHYYHHKISMVFSFSIIKMTIKKEDFLQMLASFESQSIDRLPKSAHWKGTAPARLSFCVNVCDAHVVIVFKYLFFFFQFVVHFTK